MLRVVPILDPQKCREPGLSDLLRFRPFTNSHPKAANDEVRGDEKSGDSADLNRSTLADVRFVMRLKIFLL